MVTERTFESWQNGAARSLDAEHKKRLMAEKARDAYQVSLITTVEALKKITWHIGCFKAREEWHSADPSQDFATCPACTAEKALAAIGQKRKGAGG